MYQSDQLEHKHLLTPDANSLKSMWVMRSIMYQFLSDKTFSLPLVHK